MRITFVSHFPGRGGSTSVLLQLQEFFEVCGHTVSNVVGSDCREPVLRRYEVVPPTRSGNWRERLSGYKETVLKTKPDLVYSVSGKDELDLLRFLEVPRVRHISSLERHEFADIPYWIKQTAAYWEGCSVNTPDVLEQIDGFGDFEFAGMIAPYRINSAFFAPLARPQKTRELLTEVCYFGRLECYQKRVHWLPEIIQRCNDSGVPIQWHIYGTGPWEEPLRQQVQNRGCSQHVSFHGWVEPAAFTSLAMKHDIFFLCSRFEGLPISMIEAMLIGLAAVAPDFPTGIRYVLDQGGGWAYAPKSPKVAAETLINVVRSREKLSSAKLKAKEVAHRLFHPEVVDQQLSDLNRKIQALQFNGRALSLDSAPKMRSVRWPAFARRKWLIASKRDGFFPKSS